MKVLLIDETFPPDTRGSVPYSRDLVDYLRGKGDYADVLTVGETNRLDVEQGINGRVIRMPCHLKFQSARMSTTLIWFVLNHLNEYDIVHLNHPNPIGELAFLLSRYSRARAHAKSLLTFHAEVVPAKRFSAIYNSAITIPVLRAVDLVIVSSPNLAGSPSLLKVHPNVLAIPFGIDVRASALASRLASAGCQAYGEGFPHLLFVGRLARYKGVEVLVNAMVDAPGMLCIAGDGPQRQQLTKLNTELGLTDRIRLLGRVSDDALASLYSWADVLILPSTDSAEAFGYVLIEAMARETALITTELGTGTSWVNLHGRTGLVVAPNDSRGLADAVIRLAQDPGLLAEFKANAWKRVNECFSIEAMLERTYAAYTSLIGDNKGRLRRSST